MTWTYTGRPDENQRDEVRFLVGDTCSEDPLAQDEEIAYALGEQPTVLLAAARVLYALAAKFSRMVTSSVGGVSSQCSDIAKAFKDRAKELDPAGIVATKGSL
ncbi:MAG TPA: hypothetical protein VMV58_00230, partial [Desulfosporosinus sp.]|nr:hypothetical protein [Desulfosporosinus sp.]